VNAWIVWTNNDSNCFSAQSWLHSSQNTFEIYGDCI